jgi:hypothetical protein
MNISTKSTKDDVAEFMAEIEAKAAAEHKTPRVYLASKSNGLKQMFIRWHKEEIEQLEKVKSLHD